MPESYAPAPKRRTRPRNRARPWVQGFSVLGLNLSFGPFAQWQAKGVCLPVMNCHSCAWAIFGCPIGMLSHYAGYRVFPFLIVGLLLLIGALVGRFFCGWICPFGTLQDWLYRIRTRKFALPRWAPWIKYAVLALMVFIFPWWWGELTMASFCRWCPPTTVQVTLPSLFSNAAVVITPSMAIKLAIAVLVFGACIWVTRFFCRVICPIGAMMALSNHFSLWRVGPMKSRCTSCARCDEACPTQVTPGERLSKNIPASRHADCVVCHDCTLGCVRAGRKT